MCKSYEEKIVMLTNEIERLNAVLEMKRKEIEELN